MGIDFDCGCTLETGHLKTEGLASASGTKFNNMVTHAFA